MMSRGNQVVDVTSKRRLRRLARILADAMSLLTPRLKPAAPRRARQRIGVFLQWGIGDALLALPLLQGLKEAYPDSEIELIGKPWLADVFSKQTFFGRVHPLVPPWTKPHGKYRIWEPDWRRFLHQLIVLRQVPYDLLIGIRLDVREVLQLRLLKAHETAGFTVSGGRFWVTHDLGLDLPGYQSMHRSEIASQALKTLTDLVRPAASLLTITEEERCQALERLRTGGYRDGLILAVHGGAGMPLRRWEGEKFTAVLRGLPETVKFVAIIGDSDSESGYCIETPHSVPSMIWRSNLADLRGLMAVADVLLCCDSGVMHLAAASGCSVVAIFGPTSMERFGPCGQGHKVVKIDPMPCRPCFDHCIYASPICMDGITVDSVSDALGRTIGGIAGPRSAAVTTGR